MLLWLLNLEFKGGGAVEEETELGSACSNVADVLSGTGSHDPVLGGCGVSGTPLSAEGTIRKISQ